MTTDVALIGCGAPGRGMGWYHASQMLDGEVPSAKLTDIVEPWFLGAGAGSPGSADFEAFRKTAEARGVKFHATVGAMAKPSGKKLAIVSTRTADMPRIVTEAIAAGLTHIFLEKPGAPTVAALEAMALEASNAGVSVYMGYNKNVTDYVTKGRAALDKVPGGEFTLVHHNAYKAEELDECFERNAEGILKNMAIHELAILVTYFGVNSETVASVVADRAYSTCETRVGPTTGQAYMDFAKIGFTVKTKAGAVVTVRADRCGGGLPGGAMADGAMMYASVGKEGIVHCRAAMPDADLEAAVAKRTAKSPDTLSYFLLQHDDYVTLKERCCAHIAHGTAGSPEGIATIGIGVETLKLAEMLKPELERQLKA
ncbi:hypothetical protein M885DRAFT_555735 [Pelagophyceae sp. CCMP2097]|nr:hypothetical protein M885DRAFT_555735 [Pelagophyceae sp. CCMP2097]